MVKKILINNLGHLFKIVRNHKGREVFRQFCGFGHTKIFFNVGKMCQLKCKTSGF